MKKSQSSKESSPSKTVLTLGSSVCIIVMLRYRSLRQKYPYFDSRTNPSYLTNSVVSSGNVRMSRSYSIPGDDDDVNHVNIQLHSLQGRIPLYITGNCKSCVYSKLLLRCRGYSCVVDV